MARSTIFRDAHDGERLLLELVSEIKHHDTLSDLVALVTRRIERALHPEQGARASYR